MGEKEVEVEGGEVRAVAAVKHRAPALLPQGEGAVELQLPRGGESGPGGEGEQGGEGVEGAAGPPHCPQARGLGGPEVEGGGGEEGGHRWGAGGGLKEAGGGGLPLLNPLLPLLLRHGVHLHPRQVQGAGGGGEAQHPALPPLQGPQVVGSHLRTVD